MMHSAVAFLNDVHGVVNCSPIIPDLIEGI